MATQTAKAQGKAQGKVQAKAVVEAPGTVPHTQLHFRPAGQVAPYKVVEEYWQTKADGTALRVASKVMAGRFPTLQAATEWADKLERHEVSGPPPRRGRTSTLTAEEKIIHRRKWGKDYRARREALLASLRAEVEAQRAALGKASEAEAAPAPEAAAAE